ncbi:MAG TPA: PadR family transcriptional regulator [Gemmatimonadales bacterium]|jgi:transcriptional regulator
MARKDPDLLQGTLDLLILKTLGLEPQHGWAIAKRIQAISRDVLLINQGSLYPALYRLEDEDLISGEWRVSDEGRRIKVYHLTAAGRARLVRETNTWRLFSGAVDLILAAEHPGGS